jgi:hypothetical protein
LIPRGRYLLNSSEPSVCCAYNRPAVLVRDQFNFSIEAEDATVFVGDDIALSSALHFDHSKHFAVHGLTIRGNRTNLRPTQENVGLTFSSDIDFVVDGIQFVGDFSGNGAAIAGDWLVDAKFTHITASGVGHCFDLAYLLRVAISDVKATGAGSPDADAPGQTCVSVIQDPPNAARNRTGVVYNSSAEVAISGVNEANFNTGALLSAGRHYILSDNYWHDNKGSGRAQAIGVWIKHGPTPQSGVPNGEIRIIGDRFKNNEAERGLVETTGRPNQER